MALRIDGDPGPELRQHVLPQVEPESLAEDLLELGEALAATGIRLLGQFDDLGVELISATARRTPSTRRAVAGANRS